MAETKDTLRGDRFKPLPPQCHAPHCDRAPRTRLEGRAFCGLHEQRWRKHGSTENPPKPPRPWRTCTAADCTSKARTREGRLCEMHYYRQYRTGALDLRGREPKSGIRATIGTAKPSGVTITSHGYAWTYAPAHPVAGSSGALYVHRAVLYDAIGPGSHPCYWCKATITWSAKGKEKLVVDHLDGDKLNNAPSNLVPSCHRCNSTRGLFERWVREHKDDPFLATIFHRAQAA